MPPTATAPLGRLGRGGLPRSCAHTLLYLEQQRLGHPKPLSGLPKYFFHRSCIRPGRTRRLGLAAREARCEASPNGVGPSTNGNGAGAGNQDPWIRTASTPNAGNDWWADFARGFRCPAVHPGPRLPHPAVSCRSGPNAMRFALEPCHVLCMQYELHFTCWQQG